MRLREKLEQRGIEVAEREYSDHHELVADFGPSEEVSVDVVGGDAIVVHGEETYEFAVGDSAQAFIKNGVLTINLDEESES